MLKKDIVVAATKLVLVGWLFSQFPAITNSSAANSIIAKSDVTVQNVTEDNNVEYVYLSDYRNQDAQFSDEDLAQLLYCVGFRKSDLREAWAVAKKESNGRPLAYNGNSNTGDNSYGIFQINMIDNLGPARRDKFELTYNRDLLNPVINAEIAFHMSQGGDNWTSWKGMTPRTKKWIAQYPTDFKPSPCKESRPKKDEKNK